MTAILIPPNPGPDYDYLRCTFANGEMLELPRWIDYATANWDSSGGDVLFDLPGTILVYKLGGDVIVVWIHKDRIE